GVFQLSRKDIDQVASGTAVSVKPMAYGTADGMITREGSGGGHPAALRSHDGRLWFATIQGAAVIDPEAIRTNRQPPPVVIEQILLNDRSIAPSDQLQLPAGTSRLD